jgi:RNA polymerase sigma-54 factor
MSRLLNRPTPKQRPSARLRQRLEILSLPRWRLLAHAYATGLIQPTDGETTPFDWIASKKSREAELLEEMQLNHGYGPQQKRILAELIGNLDKYGFLADSVGAIAARLYVSEKEVQDMRRDLKNFENQGVGSLHFLDFLLFQLALISEESDDPIPRKMFHFFSRVQQSGGSMGFVQVMRRIHRQLDSEFLDYLSGGKIRMTPWPADGDATKCRALPDVYVTVENGTPKVEISRDFQDSSVVEILNSKGKNSHALWTAIDLRESTLKRVCERIFTHQMPFLLYDVKALGILAQKKIADELNLSPSTVSRALANKYARTPHGTFRLADFLPTELSSSRLYVSYLIDRTIAKSWENTLLSDKKMADRIWEDFEVRVSRRFLATLRRVPY